MSITVPENIQEMLIQGEKQKRALSFCRYIKRSSLKTKGQYLRYCTDPVKQAVINQMTGWQRHQWEKAGYPTDKLDYFVTLTKESRNVA